MSSRKTERQLDLVFILLNASRAIGKDQIREKIEDYRNQENTESFERMFERDKDELRSIGIPIETVTLDPLFDDEYGYKLEIENLAIRQTIFDQAELTELTRAALIWQDSSLSASARLGLIKTHTAVDSKLDITEEFSFREMISSHQYVTLSEALFHQRGVEFEYVSVAKSLPSIKRVLPKQIVNRKSHVYLHGFDLAEGKLKTFNVSRILGEIIEFEPSSIELSKAKRIDDVGNQAPKIARIKPLISATAILHHIGGIEKAGVVEVEYFDDESFAVFLAPFSSNIADIEPKSLKDQVIKNLQSVLEKINE